MRALYASRRAVKAQTSFVVLIVEPIGDFSPNVFREKPEQFRVIARIPFPTLGAADTKRFIFNDTAKRLGSAAHRWAIAG